METAYHEWLELDRLLAEPRGLHSICLRVLYDPQIGTDGSSEGRRMKILLPEVMTRGKVDLVGHHG